MHVLDTSHNCLSFCPVLHHRFPSAEADPVSAITPTVSSRSVPVFHLLSLLQCIKPDGVLLPVSLAGPSQKGQEKEPLSGNISEVDTTGASDLTARTYRLESNGPPSPHLASSVARICNAFSDSIHVPHSSLIIIASLQG